jgi:hypothetical protein
VKVLSTVLVCFLLAACGRKIVVNDIVVYEKHWNRALSDIRPRATVELDCPGTQLQFTLLQRSGRVPTNVAVQGCGKTALYERPVARAGTMTAVGTWTLASIRKDTEPQLATQPAPDAQSL